MTTLRENQHVAITGLAQHPVHGVLRFRSGSGKSWGVWIPGPHFDNGFDNGFFCYCPPETLTPLDLPLHDFEKPFGQYIVATCEHCPKPEGQP